MRLSRMVKDIHCPSPSSCLPPFIKKVLTPWETTKPESKEVKDKLVKIVSRNERITETANSHPDLYFNGGSSIRNLDHSTTTQHDNNNNRDETVSQRTSPDKPGTSPLQCVP